MLISFFDFCNKSFLFPIRTKYLTDRLASYLGESNNILDLGSSDGKLASQLQKRISRAKFIGIDTNVQPKTHIKIIKYDGLKIPFSDNFFDTVMIVDVLHHDIDYKKIINEAKRVTKKYILIKDHYFENKIDFITLKVADYLGNKPYGISLPFNYYKVSQWQKLFNKIGVTIVKTEKFRYNFLDPCKHIIFLLVLDKSKKDV